jgi:hypothetical protein
VLIVGDTAV